MKEITTLFLVLLAVYLVISACLYAYQRKLIYYPVPLDPKFSAQEIGFSNDGVELHGWVLNPGKPDAVLYFGGNSELITNRQSYFEDIFRDYSVYLVNYRGYGLSRGQPSEAALFSDALAIYDQISKQHATAIAYGRSLGSGVAVYLAAMRPLQKLILLTPYDSITAVAQDAYPMFPIPYLLKDHFDSASIAGRIEVPVMIASAEHDRLIKPGRTLALKQEFVRTTVDYRMISGAAHNDITDFAEYRSAVREFLSN